LFSSYLDDGYVSEQIEYIPMNSEDTLPILEVGQYATVDAKSHQITTSPKAKQEASTFNITQRGKIEEEDISDLLPKAVPLQQSHVKSQTTKPAQKKEIGKVASVVNFVRASLVVVRERLGRWESITIRAWLLWTGYGTDLTEHRKVWERLSRESGEIE
jgi:hypothetical protein